MGPKTSWLRVTPRKRNWELILSNLTYQIVSSAHRELSKNDLFGIYIHVVYVFRLKKYVHYHVYSAKFGIFGKIIQQITLPNLHLIFQYQNMNTSCKRSCRNIFFLHVACTINCSVLTDVCEFNPSLVIYFCYVSYLISIEIKSKN